MSSSAAANHYAGITLRQAALIAGLGTLIMTVVAPFADLFVYPKVVIPGLFVGAIFCYLITFMIDVVLAGAFYILLAPVNRSLSLLTAWFRLMYTAIALFATLKLVAVFRLLNTPDYLATFGSQQLQAQVKLMLGTFRSDWSTGLFLLTFILACSATSFTALATSPRLLGLFWQWMDWAG